MLEFYYLGCLIAFIFGLIWFLLCIYYYIFEKTDIETDNYKEIGLFYNFFSIWFNEGKSDWGNFIFWIFMCFWIWILLSWISVVFYLFGLIKKIKWEFFDLPNDIREEIKKSKFKIKNTKLSSKREINEIVYFINNWQKVNESWDYLLWTVDMSPKDIDSIGRHLYIYYDKLENRERYIPWDTNSIANYKIEWNKVFAKTIEICHKYPWKEDKYTIKNWKINEEIIKKEWESSVLAKRQSLKDYIQDYKNLVKWFELRQDRTDYILYYNLSTSDFKEFAETAINRLKIWKEKRDETYDNIKKKYGDTIKWDKLIELMDKWLKKYWFTDNELASCEERIKRLEDILNWKIRS